MSSISSVLSSNPAYQNYNTSNVQQTVQDFQALGSALQSGDVSSAQSALTTFQQALATATNSQSSSSQPFGKNSQANTDYQSLASALQSGNLTTAQQAFSRLQTDLKPAHTGHHHHHGSATSTTATTNTANTAASTTSVTGSAGNLLDTSA